MSGLLHAISYPGLEGNQVDNLEGEMNEWTKSVNGVNFLCWFRARDPFDLRLTNLYAPLQTARTPRKERSRVP